MANFELKVKGAANATHYIGGRVAPYVVWSQQPQGGWLPYQMFKEASELAEFFAEASATNFQAVLAVRHHSFVPNSGKIPSYEYEGEEDVYTVLFED